MTSSLPDYQRELATNLSDNAVPAELGVILSDNTPKRGLSVKLSHNP